MNCQGQYNLMYTSFVQTGRGICRICLKGMRLYLCSDLPRNNVAPQQAVYCEQSAEQSRSDVASRTGLSDRVQLLYLTFQVGAVKRM